MEEICSHCGHSDERKAHHSGVFKKDLITRLNRIEGQVRGINRMVEEDVYCDDVLNQINSVTSALNGVRKTLLEAHLKSCIIERLKDGDEKVVEELMLTIEKMLK